MVEETNGAGGSEQSPERLAIRAIGTALNESLDKISAAEQSQLVAMAGLAALVAALPGVAGIDPVRVGAMVGQFAKGRPDEAEFRDKVALFAARIITIAQSAPQSGAGAVPN